jgi:glycosyltransferase involved in cell wall biosynthesis
MSTMFERRRLPEPREPEIHGTIRVALADRNLHGGVGVVYIRLAEEFLRRGIAVDILTYAKARDAELPAPEGTNLLRAAGPEGLSGLVLMARYLHRYRPQAMILHRRKTLALALTARRLTRSSVQLYAVMHNLIISPETRNPKRKLRKEGRLLGQMDGIGAVSACLADETASVYGLARDRIDVLPNPVVTDELLAKAQAKPDHPWLAPDSVPLILGAGRLDAQKDFATLIKAFARVREDRPCRLLIAGDGPQRSALETLVNDLALRNDILLPGHLADLPAWMRQAALFVLSSAWEGFGNVLVEAMAIGTPVVSTDCRCGPREILQNGRWGPLVQVGDDTALARAMVATLDEPPRSESLYEATARYSATASAKAYLGALGLSSR